MSLKEQKVEIYSDNNIEINENNINLKTAIQKNASTPETPYSQYAKPSELTEKNKKHPLRRLRKRPNMKKLSDAEIKKFNKETDEMINAYMKNKEITKCPPMWAKGSISSSTLPVSE